MSTLTQIPQNYQKNVDWILGAYSDAGVKFPNGFQKDAIQNAVGARATHDWKNWSCDISITENSKGCFIIIEDKGTLGLTGNNMSTEIINEKMRSGEKLQASERLSRFTSMFNSGDNSTGGGLYGAGKSVYSVASKSYTYYFDSLRKDNKYVANVNKKGQVYPVAFEDNDAKSFIKENTGLDEKTTVGTRIIIENPKDELVNAIKTKEIFKDIQESWWLIIKRLGQDSCISVNGEPVLLPENLYESKHKYELVHPEKYSENYTVKHFGLFISENPKWKGISYYRKGMKIGDIDLKSIPKELEGKFWGYIEVDEKWEDELARIEDNVHFGVSRGKKGTVQYQNLKNYCEQIVRANLVEWGYIKDKENEDKKLQEELKKIAEDIQDLFEKLGFEDLGKGPKKSDFDVRWQNIKYPVLNSEKVTTGDLIEFSIRIKSSYIVDKKFEYKLYVQDPQTGEKLSLIKQEKIQIQSNSIYTEKFVHKVDKSNSKQFSANRIVFEVKINGSGKTKKKELQYFYDIDRPDSCRNVVNLVLHECTFPRKNSRRVNFNESIKNISYLIENKRNINLNYKINISIHNAMSPSNDKIKDVFSSFGVISPFEEIVTPQIDEIFFDKDFYEQYITSGILELRARLIANEDDDIYEKGDRITKYEYKIYLNCDEKNGKNDSFNIRSINAPDKFERSWCEPGNDRTIVINVGHVAYLRASDYPEFQHEYMREQMLKQYVLLYLKEGKYDTFKGDNNFSDLEPQEAAELVIDKIENIYFQSLK